MIRTPKILQWFYPKFIWKKKNQNNSIYLTFDDGPIPDVTEKILDILKEFDIKATFFCIGDNIQKHPEVFQRIINEGHSIGNHTFNHINGWKSKNNIYLENSLKAQKSIEKKYTSENKLFRPPYGRIKKSQSKELIKEGFKIMMWTVLTKDYDKKITPQQCFQNSIKGIKSGDILLFHDSKKAEQNVLYSLPKTIDYLKKKGFNFELL